MDSAEPVIDGLVYHRGFREYAVYLGTDEMSDPTRRTVHVRFDDGREAMVYRHLLTAVCPHLVAMSDGCLKCERVGVRSESGR